MRDDSRNELVGDLTDTATNLLAQPFQPIRTCGGRSEPLLLGGRFGPLTLRNTRCDVDAKGLGNMPVVAARKVAQTLADNFGDRGA